MISTFGNVVVDDPSSGANHRPIVSIPLGSGALYGAANARAAAAVHHHLSSLVVSSGAYHHRDASAGTPAITTAAAAAAGRPLSLNSLIRSSSTSTNAAVAAAVAAADYASLVAQQQQQQQQQHHHHQHHHHQQHQHQHPHQQHHNGGAAAGANVFLAAAAAAAAARNCSNMATVGGQPPQESGTGGRSITTGSSGAHRFDSSTDDMDEEESYSQTGNTDDRNAGQINFNSNDPSGKLSGKLCRVCGDKALGYNFNVVSCESCKAFFRRNALKRKEFRCPFTDNCEVTALSRRFCQKCRLKKCFDAGMKKEWIMSDEQRLLKRKRIEENRQKRRAVTDKPGQIKREETSAESPSATTTAECQTSGVVNNAGERASQPNHLYSNVGFSPESKPLTSPVVLGLGSDFSPPDSIEQSHTHSLDDHQTRIAAQRPVSAGTNTGHSLESGGVATRPSTREGDSDFPLTVRTQRSSQQSEHSSPKHHNHHVTTTMMTPPVAQPPRPSPASSLGILSPPLTTTSSCGPSPSAMTIATRAQEPMEFDESMITIPKSVLINLIKQCHTAMPGGGCAGGGGRGGEMMVPPVVARAHRLCTGAGANSDDDAFKCICRCACGARVAGGSIGPKLVDRAVGPDNNNDQDQDRDQIRPPTGTLRNEECSSGLMFSEEHDEEHLEEVEQDEGGDDEEEEDAAAALSAPMHAIAFDDAGCGMSSGDSNYFNPMEMAKLRELYLANQVMDEDPDYSKVGNELNAKSTSPQPIGMETAAAGTSTSEITPGMSATDMIQMTDVCVRRIIKMCKRITAFKNLTQEDQIALLKGGCTELMILRGVMTFVPEKESWRPVGWKNTLLSLDVLKWVKGNVYQEHSKYLRSFRDEWRTNDSIMLCVAAITLFNPERVNLVHTETVHKERSFYVNLLKRCLDLMYGTNSMASHEALQELMVRVKEVRRLNDYTATVFLEMGPGDMEPLLIEVFDMK